MSPAAEPRANIKVLNQNRRFSVTSFPTFRLSLLDLLRILRGRHSRQRTPVLQAEPEEDMTPAPFFGESRAQGCAVSTAESGVVEGSHFDTGVDVSASMTVS